MARILPTDRILVAGKTRTGKSTVALYLFSRFRGQRVAIDPKAEWVMPGALTVRSPEQLAVALERAPLIRYIPTRADRDEWEAVYGLLFETVRRRRRGLVILTHEAAAVSSASWRPTGLRMIQQQGAALGIGHVVCTQRPVHVAKELLTEAEHVFVFTPPFKNRQDLVDLAPVMNLTADELRDRLVALPEYSFLWWDDRAGELTTVPGGLGPELRAATGARSVLVR